MNSPGQLLTLSYRTVDGSTRQVDATVLTAPSPTTAPLFTRLLKLEDGREARQVTVGRLSNREDRSRGYGMIDSEILAGLRLVRQAKHSAYPPQLARLIGYDADGAEPFALFEPYRGEAVDAVAGHLLPTGQHKFQVGLLTGLRWLAEAGIAHRGIGPTTVRWDGEQAQITDFHLATVIGADRQVVGQRPWAAPEQRPGQAIGQVGDRDDIWATGRLIFYVVTGQELVERDQIADWPTLMDLLDDVFGPPADRPNARELLTVRLRERDPVPQSIGSESLLNAGRADFEIARQRRQDRAAAVAGSSALTGSKRDRTGKSWLRMLPFLIVLMVLMALGLEVWPK
jgi:hypothetical protein